MCVWFWFYTSSRSPPCSGLLTYLALKLTQTLTSSSNIITAGPKGDHEESGAVETNPFPFPCETVELITQSVTHHTSQARLQFFHFTAEANGFNNHSRHQMPMYCKERWVKFTLASASAGSLDAVSGTCNIHIKIFQKWEPDAQDAKNEGKQYHGTCNFSRTVWGKQLRNCETNKCFLPAGYKITSVRSKKGSMLYLLVFNGSSVFMYQQEWTLPQAYSQSVEPWTLETWCTSSSM